MWRIKIAPTVPNQMPTGGPASASEDFMTFKPGLRIILVRVRRKTGKWSEVGARPLPHIPEHLSASKGAVTLRQSVYRDTTHRLTGHIGMLWCWSRISPRIAALVSGNPLPIGTWLSGSSQFPLGFCRQPSSSPTTIGVGFVPVDVDDGTVWLKRYKLVKMTT